MSSVVPIGKKSGAIIAEQWQDVSQQSAGRKLASSR